MRTSGRLALGLGAFFLVAVAVPITSGQPALAQSPSTDSAQTVHASTYDPDSADAPFPDLAVTVSQTNDLIAQGVTVSWTGGKASTVPNQQTGGTNFLQIAQCWGDEPGSNGTRPDRTTCQYGGLNLPGATRSSNRSSDTEAAPQDAAYTAVSDSWTDPTKTAIPFRSATGKTLAAVVDGKAVADAPDLDSNEFFTKYTTNEVSWAGSGADGSGSVSFELQTAQQAPGLGCGAATKAKGRSTTGAACWLVIIPRGDTDAGGAGITQSGLFWETWKHHLALRLHFKPAGVQCALGAAERQLSGSELVSSAIGQWQPKLCTSSGGAIYSLLTGPESDAAAAANGTTTAPLALTSRALSSGVTDNLAYAPVALTGVSIAFAIDRESRVTGNSVPEAVQAKERQAFSTLRLTPRLLAKLLTASYTDALPDGADWSHLSGVRNLTVDPEFLAINDKEWSYMHIVGVGVGDALMPLGRSDAARAIWTYILSDDDAVDFLNGVPDKWGMAVNPWYSTNPRVNPSGVGLSLPRDDFPKADPVEFTGTAGNGYADVVNLVTWRPYTASLGTGGYQVLRGDPSKLGTWDQTATPPKYTKADRQLVGLQSVIGLTDTAAAATYQVAQAALLNPAGRYVAPTAASLSAAAAVMTASTGSKQVQQFDPGSAGAKAAKAAYPLAMPVYAAANPAMADAAVRADYADFIDYAATSGQRPGTDDGDLPDGYAPLPAGWRTQALAAAAAIKAGHWPATASTGSSTSASPGSTSTAAAGAAPVTTATSKPSSAASPSAAASPAAGATPDDPAVTPLVAVVPGAAVLGLGAACGAPLVGRFRRREP